MKKTVSVQIPEEKLSAIEMYLEQKNTTLSAEMEKYVELIYSKYVPLNVREYIDLMSKQPKRRPRKPAEDTNPTEQ